MKPRHEREREFRREYIIEATENLLKEKTFEAITMDDIALAAGFAKASIYQYFNNKEELLIGVFLKAVKTECQLIEERCLPQADPVQALRNYLMLEFELIHWYSWILKVIRTVTLKDFTENSLLHERDRKKELIAEIIRQGQAKGVFIIGDTEVLTNMILTVSEGFALYYTGMAVFFTADNTTDNTKKPEIEMFISTMMKGISRENKND
jgi:AcrR family transcriptional regulator